MKLCQKLKRADLDGLDLMIVEAGKKIRRGPLLKKQVQDNLKSDIANLKFNNFFKI